VAVRIGEASLQAARTRVIGQTQAVLVASPSLLRGRVVRTLAEVAALPAVLPIEGGAAVLKALGVARGGKGLEVKLRVDDVEVIREAVVNGVGASALPEWLVEDDVRAGRLVQLAPSVALPALPIRVVFAAAPTRLTRALAEAISTALPPVLSRPGR
jgi:DNA-binding transcriptional LysR family regulator